MNRKRWFELTDGEPTSRKSWMVREPATPWGGEEESLPDVFPQVIEAISANLDRSLSILGSLEQKLERFAR